LYIYSSNPYNAHFFNKTMERVSKYVLVVLFSFGILLSTSCQKKWKKPTGVVFNLQLGSNSASGPVNFTSGYMVLNKVSFTGERKQGVQHIALDQSYSGTNPVNFSGNATGIGINFDIPQGTYSQIDVNLETGTDTHGNSIQINGTFVDSLNHTYAVQFIFSAANSTTIRATNTSGGNEINLVADRPETATIIMNPSYWFAALSKSMMNKAEHETVGGVQTIQISNDENENLYSLIVNRIKDGNSVIFN